MNKNKLPPIEIIKNSYIENIHSGIVFHKINTKKNLNQYSFDPFTLNTENPDFCPNGFKLTKNNIGYKYIILIHNESEIDIFSAILGDPHQFILNHVNSNYEGTIIKHSINSVNFLNDIYEKFIDSYYSKLYDIID